jgi:hypothetical protein
MRSTNQPTTELKSRQENTVMATFETGSFNPRSTNGSALDFMNFNPYATQQFATQQNLPYQQSFLPQQQQQSFPQQQSLFGQSPWQQQSFQGAPWQQLQGAPWQQQLGGFGAQNPMLNIPPQIAQLQGSPWQTPYAQGFNPQMQMQQPGISPFAGVPTQQIAPVVTTRSAEIRVTLPVHRLIHKPPQEIVQYLTYVVLPVLLDGLVKRSVHPELGLSVSNDLRGECVAEIEI